MASAWKAKDGESYIARFRPLYGAKDTWRVLRVPKSVWEKSTDPLAACRHFAKEECDRYCRLIEADPQATYVERARAIGAITEQEAAAILKTDYHAPAPAQKGPLKIREAWLMHPSTEFEKNNRASEHKRHEMGMDEFLAWSKIENLRELRPEDVLRYLNHLRTGLKFKFNSRRHRLIPIRRATMMGPGRGIPDVLNNLKLDRDEGTAEPEAWTDKELRKAIRGLAALEDRRAIAVLALGAFLGLRPSEILRAQVGDVAKHEKKHVLRVGVRQAKNKQSRRDLPIPPTAFTWIEPLTIGRPPEAPLIPPLTGKGNPRDEEFYDTALNQHFTPMIAAATGRRLTIGCLRNTLITFAERSGIDESIWERWAGHRLSRPSKVSSKHYIKPSDVDRLYPMGERIEEWIGTLLKKAKDDPSEPASATLSS